MLKDPFLCCFYLDKTKVKTACLFFLFSPFLYFPVCFLFPPGAESISVYEDVLRSVRYRLAKGSARFERRFRLSCSEMNGRYTSNELTLEVKKTLPQITPQKIPQLSASTFWETVCIKAIMLNPYDVFAVIPVLFCYFPVGELPPLLGQLVPPVPPAGLKAAVPPSVPPCWRAERTHFAQSTPQLR